MGAMVRDSSVVLGVSDDAHVARRLLDLTAVAQA
jgi:hypothetical protein